MTNLTNKISILKILVYFCPKQIQKLKKIIIVGSGFSSLAAACYMQQAGHQVTVLEKNEQIGGRASIWESNGFKFDMGPSWYWMPDIFERFFNDFGKSASDYYILEKLSPAYRVFFGQQDWIDISDNLKNIISTFENIDKGSGKKLQSFMDKARKNYEIAMKDLVYQPGRSITELVSLETAKRLNLFVKNISTDVKKITDNPKLQSILEFPVLFLGAKPQDTPAFYNFMNWADFGLGTWYPKGGMNKVVQGMKSLAEELGVQFKVNEEVINFNLNGIKVNSAQTLKETYEADIFISGADYAHTETLLDEKRKNYSENYWDKKTFAPSSLLYYVGLNSPIKNVEHHNLFFDTDFGQHAKEIYDTKVFPKKPLFYANFPSISDESLAPQGMATAFFLIPVAVDLEDNEEIHEQYFDLILNRLEKNTGENVRDKIVYKKSFGVKDFKNRYHSCKGNAYGMANTLLQTSVLRPSIKNKHLNNLYYTGQLTVPGPGVPPALISGKVVSEYILKTHKV